MLLGNKWLRHNQEWILVVSGVPISLFPTMSPDSTYAKSFIKLPLDETDKSGL